MPSPSRFACQIPHSVALRHLSPAGESLSSKWEPLASRISLHKTLGPNRNKRRRGLSLLEGRFYAEIDPRRFRQRQDDAAVSPHPHPRRGGAKEHSAGAGAVHVLHRGAHLPRIGGCAVRHGGELFLHEPCREDFVRRGRQRRADPLRRGAGRAGAPRTGRIAGQCPLLLPPPPECGFLPDGGRDHRRAEERGPVRHPAGGAGQELRGREREAERIGADLPRLRDAAVPQRHGPRRPAGTGRCPARRGTGGGRGAGISAGAGSVHRRVRYLQRAQKAAAGGHAGRAALRDRGPLR